MLIRDLFQKKTSSRIPVWFMRQAGRYLPEYRAIRSHFDDFMKFCYTPGKAKEVTLQPLHRFDLDAAIIFSDILVIPHALGQGVSFKKDHGPVLESYALKTLTSPDTLSSFLSPVYEAITLTRAELDKDKALFGFAGTPWTLACYMVEEGKSENFKKINAYAKEEAFKELLSLLTQAVTVHLKNQIKAGADIVQIFDSWAIKAPKGYEASFLIDPFIHIAKEVHRDYPTTPIIYYARCDKDLYLTMVQAIERECKGAPIGLGVWQGVSLEELRGHTSLPLQGNLDPELLLKGGEVMEEAAHRICESMHGHPFIFNLGHGVIKDTPITHVEKLIQCIRRGV